MLCQKSSVRANLNIQVLNCFFNFEISFLVCKLVIVVIYCSPDVKHESQLSVGVTSEAGTA
jgi:hypothetical protein